MILIRFRTAWYIEITVELRDYRYFLIFLVCSLLQLSLLMNYAAWVAFLSAMKKVSSVFFGKHEQIERSLKRNFG